MQCMYDASSLPRYATNDTLGASVVLWCSSGLTRLRQPQRHTRLRRVHAILCFFTCGEPQRSSRCPAPCIACNTPCQKTSRPFLCGLAMRQRGGAGEMKRRGKKGESNTNLGEYEREERARTRDFLRHTGQLVVVPVDKCT